MFPDASSSLLFTFLVSLLTLYLRQIFLENNALKAVAEDIPHLGQKVVTFSWSGLQPLKIFYVLPGIIRARIHQVRHNSELLLLAVWELFFMSCANMSQTLIKLVTVFKHHQTCPYNMSLFWILMVYTHHVCTHIHCCAWHIVSFILLCISYSLQLKHLYFLEKKSEWVEDISTWPLDMQSSHISHSMEQCTPAWSVKCAIHMTCLLGLLIQTCEYHVPDSVKMEVIHESFVKYCISHMDYTSAGHIK